MLASRNKHQSELSWTHMEENHSHSLTLMKSAVEAELVELFLLYDPESTGQLGLSDFYLLLKDLFINHRSLILYMTKPEDNLFEVEGSYKVLMSKLDLLLFDEIGLSKRMYQKAKNVAIDLQMFWMIVDALLHTGILKISSGIQGDVHFD